MKAVNSGEKYQKGTSMVEFAFVAPLFFLLLFGIIEFSVILFDKAVITNASREGARAGIVFRDGNRASGSTDLAAETTEIQNVVNNYASAYLISLGGASTITTVVTRALDTGPDDDLIFDVGDELTVDVQYPYSYLILPGFVNALSNFTLGATTVMLAE